MRNLLPHATAPFVKYTQNSEITLGQAGRLSERQRVKPRLSLPLIRIRYFVVSLIPWSEALSHPPSPQNTS